MLRPNDSAYSAMTLLDFELGVTVSPPRPDEEKTRSSLADPESYGMSLPESFLRKGPVTNFLQ